VLDRVLASGFIGVVAERFVGETAVVEYGPTAAGRAALDAERARA